MPIEVGDSAPGFSAEDIQGGGTIALSDYAGQTVVLTFSGLTWCGFCKQEAPVLQGLWEEYSASCEGSVQFIIISYGDVEGSSAALESAIVEYGLTMPVLVDNGIFASYGYSGVPVTYAIGPDGVVYNKALGFHTATQLRDIIEIPAIIERIRPLHVKRGESFAMTITGENLQWATALRFSGPPLKVTSLRATEHEVTAEVSAGPPSSSGTFAIYLDTVFGPADVGGRKLVIEPVTPTVSRIQPLHVKRGESFAMTITGENLQWATALRFSGPPLKVTSLRATEHEVTAEVSAGPPSSSGTFAIYLDTVFGPADVGGRKLVIEPAPLVGADTQNTTLEPVDIRRRRHE